MSYCNDTDDNDDYDGDNNYINNDNDNENNNMIKIILIQPKRFNNKKIVMIIWLSSNHQ